MQTRQNAKQIEHLKKTQQRQSTKLKKENEGTFLTGLGLASEGSKRKRESEIMEF
jgi:hypothetical protein